MSADGNVLRVRLDSTLRRALPCDIPALPLLDPAGPYACIGGEHPEADGLSIPVRPSPLTLFGPRAACLIGEALWVSDTGHHRILGWKRAPETDGIPADWIIGQADFSREGRNAKTEPSAITLNVPTGICACGEGLAVADAWNHRVLIWRQMPQASNVPADVVLGQEHFTAMESNCGQTMPTASSLFWPYGVLWDGQKLWVADTGNRRVLAWNSIPEQNAHPADLVLGQDDFTTRNENGGGEPNAASMRWPHNVARWRDKLCVTDAGNNRIMIWDAIPEKNNIPSDHLLGQANALLVDHNQSRYWPDADAVNMPYGMSAHGDWLLIADTANSRLIAWHIDDCATGAGARALSAQPDFGAKGDNRWSAPVRDSLCWPYGVMAASENDDRVVVSDSGNSRVLLWRSAYSLPSRQRGTAGTGASA